MLRLIVAVMAIVLAGYASAAGWRSLQIDGSSERAFEQSVEVFKNKLSTARRYVFDAALKDIWTQGVRAARAERREYTVADYHRQLDGLGYEQIVTFTDPTGETARRRWHGASLAARASAQRRAPTRGDTWDQGAAQRTGPDNARALAPW